MNVLSVIKHLCKRVALVALLPLFLAGCEGGSAFSGEQVPEETLLSASRLSISTDLTTVESDGSTPYATITALALDSNNAALEGALINFSTTAGLLFDASGLTDASGIATIKLSAGSDPINQTATITASSGTASPVSIPVEIVGSTVTITATRTNLVIGVTDTATLTITAANSAGVGVYDAPVTVSIDSTTSTGTANLASLSGRTDAQGKWTVTLTGITAGTVRVAATALNAIDTEDFLVESSAESLIITSPTSGATALINVAETIEVTVPSTIANITLVSSLGTWGSSGTSVAEHVGAALVTDTLTTTSVGTASIYVADSANSLVNDNIQLIFVDETVNASSVVSLQASPGTIAPSTTSTLSSSALEASVYNVGGNPIAGARVIFSIDSATTTGSGEYVYPPVAYTDAYGVARSTLYAGTQSSTGSGLSVIATLDETLTAPATVNDSVDVIVGGTAGSISIGMSTKIASINSDTGYSLPISVQVSDAGGNPVADTVVNISLWPESYALGYWVCEPEPGIWREVILANEDIDRDKILDTGEDISGDGKLTPTVSAAGTVPVSVTTDENGIGTFNLTYLKDNAGFVYNALYATTTVVGTETIASRRFWLPALESDITGCYLGESPFNTAWPALNVVATSSSVIAGGNTTLTVTLSDQEGNGMATKSVSSYILFEGSNGGVAPTLSASPETTDVNGMATFTYTAGHQAGVDLIKVTYTVNTTSGDIVIASYVWITVE